MKIAWKQIAVALILGYVIGGFTALRYCPLAHRGGWGHPEKAQHWMMDQFSSKLNLSPDQKEKISVILESTRGQMDVLRKESRPKFEAIQNSSRAEIREILNPEQQQKFDDMTAKMDARMEKRRSEWAGK